MIVKISLVLLMVSAFSLASLVSNFRAEMPTAQIYSTKLADLDNHWKDFKKNHSKIYHNLTHENERFFCLIFVQ